MSKVIRLINEKKEKELATLKYQNAYLTNQNKLLKKFLGETCKILKAFKRVGMNF